MRTFLRFVPFEGEVRLLLVMVMRPGMLCLGLRDGPRLRPKRPHHRDVLVV
tara:strand:- start:1679 stop:1831 length:153 start_codon:yes stop_codon:yes gene_type:complete